MLKDTRISIRMKQEKKEAWSKLAKDHGYTLSGLIIDLLNLFERDPDILNPTSPTSTSTIDWEEAKRIREHLERIEKQTDFLIKGMGQRKKYYLSDEEALFTE